VPGKFRPKRNGIESGIDSLRFGVDAKCPAGHIELALIDVKILAHPAARRSAKTRR
jgi:hypothetical protein